MSKRKLLAVLIAFVIMVAVRSFDDIASNGLGTWPASFTLDAFRTAWVDGQLGGALRNSVIVTSNAAVVRTIGSRVHARHSSHPRRCLRSRKPSS